MDINDWDDTWGTIDWKKDSKEKIIQKIKEFYSAGVDFNMKPEYYDGLEMTPLMFAAQYSTPEVIDFLVAGGADITLTEKGMGWTALHIAARYGKTENVRCLIKHSPKNFASKGDNDGWTSLHQAAYSGNTEIAEILINDGVPVDIRSDSKYTPLFCVPNAKMTEFLIKHGADVNAKDDDNSTALIHATYYMLKGTIKVLLKNGAKVNIQRKSDGWTALHAASYYCDSAANTIKMLVKAGEDVNTKDDGGRTPLLWAVERCSKPDGVKALIDLGADVNAKDNEDRTALHHLVHNCDSDVIDSGVIKMLIDAGVDKDAVDCNGDTALLFAIKEEKTEIAKALVEAGVGLDIKDKRGYTALHRAIWSRDAKLVRALVERGANVNIKTPEGWFPSGMGETEMRTIVANANKIRADYLKKHPQSSLCQTLGDASLPDKDPPLPIGGRDPR